MLALRHALLPTVALATALLAAPAQAISPHNPYRTFNLSGINYGSMQWERAQREGRRVWPYYNTPSRAYSSSRNSGLTLGGVVSGGGGAGTIIERGTVRSAPRSAPRVFRRWRR